MSNAITFNGLASGLDTGAIVDALVQAARQPITRLNEKKSDYQSQSSLISTLMSKLSSLRDAAQNLDTAREFWSYSAASSDTTSLTATAGSSAATGTYQVKVDLLAQAERTYSDGFIAKDQTGLVGSGTLSIQVGTTTAVNVAIDDTTDTLEMVAAKINDSGAEVSATVMNTGTEYRLVVTGNHAGDDNYVTFTEGGTLLLNLDVVANQVQAAQSAQLTLDSSVVVKGDTNQISDAIPGVTLNLMAQTASALTVTVAPDVDAIEDKVNALLTAYNDVSAFINKQFTFTGESRTDTLMGDSATRNVKRRLQSIFSGSVAALAEPFNALSRLGIKTGSDGMALNGSTFRAALAADPEAVAALFTYSDNIDSTDNDGIAVSLKRAIDGMLNSTDGLLEAHKSGLAHRIDDIDSRVASLERNLENYETGLMRQFSALEELLSGLQAQGNFLTAQGS